MNDDTQVGSANHELLQAETSARELAEELDELRLSDEVGEAGYGSAPAILVVGCQRAFTDPNSPLGADLSTALRAARRLIAAARRVAVPVLHCVRGRPQGEETVEETSLLVYKRPALAALVPGSELSAIDPRLAPEQGEPVFETDGSSAFHRTQLAACLGELEIDTVVMVGCMASDALRATAADAAQRGWKVQVPRDCVGDRHCEVLRVGLIDIQRMYGDVVEIGETLAFLERAHIESMIKVLE